jgi:hypothetical protein
MKITNLIILTFVGTVFWACGSGLPDSYHLDKRFWDIEDYNFALNQMQYDASNGEGLPRLSDPLTAPVFEKLVDFENVSVILADDRLGLDHRSKISQEYFDIAKRIIKTYHVMDVQDKYVYPIEFTKTVEFSLKTQLLYFKVGNDAILKYSIDSTSNETRSTVISNEQTIANNFVNYIEMLAKESAFDEPALKEYSEIIKECFQKLIKDFSNADYSYLKKISEKIVKKSQSEDIKEALGFIIKLIDEKQKDTED